MLTMLARRGSRMSRMRSASSSWKRPLRRCIRLFIALPSPPGLLPPQRICIWRRLAALLCVEGLDDVAFLERLEALDADAALVAVLHFANVVLEVAQAG